jgi:hypothetical protein
MNKGDIRIRLGTKHYHLDCYDKTNDPSKVKIEKGLNIRQDVKLFMEEWKNKFSLKYKRKRVVSIKDTIDTISKRKRDQNIYLLDLPSEIWIEIFKYCNWRFIIHKFSLISKYSFILSTDERLWKYQYERRYKDKLNYIGFKDIYMYDKENNSYLTKYIYLHLYSCRHCGHYDENNYFHLLDVNLCGSCKIKKCYQLYNEKDAIKRIGVDGLTNLKYQIEYNTKNKNKPLKQYLKHDVENYRKEKLKSLKHDLILNQISTKFLSDFNINLYLCGEYTRKQLFFYIEKRMKEKFKIKRI